MPYLHRDGIAFHYRDEGGGVPFVFQHGLKSLDQFWWFLCWGLLFGASFVVLRKLYANIVVHWLVILSAVLAVLQVLR